MHDYYVNSLLSYLRLSCIYSVMFLRLSCGGRLLCQFWRNLPISTSKPDLHNNVCTKFDENSFLFTQVIVRKQKYGWWRADNCQKMTK